MVCFRYGTGYVYNFFLFLVLMIFFLNEVSTLLKFCLPIVNQTMVR